MEMDLTGLWTWTVPLWGLGLLVFVLAAILTNPAEIITRIPGTRVIAAAAAAAAPAIELAAVAAAVNPPAPAGAAQGGGARSRRH